MRSLGRVIFDSCWISNLIPEKRRRRSKSQAHVLEARYRAPMSTDMQTKWLRAARRKAPRVPALRRPSSASGIVTGLIWVILLGAVPTTSAYSSNSATVQPEQMARDLANALDLRRPGLASAAAALARNDLASTEKDLAQYFRTRTSVGWQSDAVLSNHLSPLSRQIVGNALNGAFQGGSVPPLQSFPDGQIDWHFNATTGSSSQAPNYEWQWQLNRMSFWSDLSIAYRTTGDERYAAVFQKELRSWIQQCPAPRNIDNGPGSCWRTIEVGIRTGGPWMDAFYAFRSSPAMSDVDLLEMLYSLLEQGRYLRTNHTMLNWLTLEMSGLYSIGAVYPEFKDASSWRSFAAGTLAEQSHKQFLPDGGRVELSSSYQDVALESVLHIVDVARWTGNSPELPADYAAPLEKAYRWQTDIVAPDGFLPKVNDAGPTYLPTVMKKATVYFPQVPDFRWFASKGKEGVAPRFSSVYL